ncbi:MAG: hypothetical protein LBQ88_12460 [Treponema sp.]|jgi:hypothetical protein|nr:hypothetical protein [Treponema sp.]
MEDQKKDPLTAALKTTWTPDVEFNAKREADKKVTVTIEWPTIEEFDFVTGKAEGTTSMFHRLTRNFCKTIENFEIAGVPVLSGAELVAVRSRGAVKARSLSINIGSYIFEQSVLTEGEEKN